MKTLFVTKAWQNDINKIVAGGFKRKHEYCQYPFTEKWLMINNVDGPIDTLIIKELTEADRIILVADYAKKAMKYFNLDEKTLGNGYVYSITELVELYLAEDFDYLCHFASDTLLHKPYDWITPSLTIMHNCPDIITTAPNSEDSITYGLKNQYFSDQAYLLKVKEWRSPMSFTYLSPDLPEYPPRAGDALFERRAARYLFNIGRYRQLIKDCWYNHPSW